MLRHRKLRSVVAHAYTSQTFAKTTAEVSLSFTNRELKIETFSGRQEPLWLLITAVDKASKTNPRKTTQAEFFCVRQVYFTNSCQQIWGCVNQPFILFIHDLRWNSTYNLSYRPRTEHGISQFFNTNCTQSMFGTINRGLLAKPLKKISKITH